MKIRPLLKWLLKVLKWTSLVIVGLIAFVILITYWLFRGSLPDLEGELELPGLISDVVIMRDVKGVPEITAVNRLDAARAIGFLHAQDRFFQMDLLRRNASGELSEIIGQATVDHDKRTRVHGLRQNAQRIFDTLSANEKKLLVAYSNGVNSGLEQLDVRPFEYLVLRAPLRKWTPEDSLLVIYSLYLDLQDENGDQERMMDTMSTQLPEPVFDFFVNNGFAWEAPLDLSYSKIKAVPPPEAWSYLSDFSGIKLSKKADFLRNDTPSAGSNSWAVAGNLTKTGHAMMANDIHLNLSLPNSWYRMVIHYQERNREEPRTVSGVTLPGLPLIVAGSNGQISWGFTNAYADTTDLVLVETDENNWDVYKTEKMLKYFGSRMESIRVRSGNPVIFDVRTTIWGPIVDKSLAGTLTAVKWIGHTDYAIDLNLINLESAENVDEAVAVANNSNFPVLNFIVADNDGRIGWSLGGTLPDRDGKKGNLPVSYRQAKNAWKGRLPGTEYPSIMDPINGRLWSANNRIVGGKALDLLGDSGYVADGRAYQIRYSLFGMNDEITERDMHLLQLNDKAQFMTRWYNLIVQTLDKELVDQDPRKKKLLNVLLNWNQEASEFSSAYRIIRSFRSFLAKRVFERLLIPCYVADGSFRYYNFSYEEPLWIILEEKPDYLIDPEIGSWNGEIIATMDEVLDYFDSLGGDSFTDHTWGEYNTIHIQHPLSKALPFLSGLMDMPEQPMSGDKYVPHVINPGFGATVRLVITPGYEDNSIFNMPGGQSGHPLSDFYDTDQDDWVVGRPVSLLPGATEYKLILKGSLSSR